MTKYKIEKNFEVILTDKVPDENNTALYIRKNKNGVVKRKIYINNKYDSLDKTILLLHEFFHMIQYETLAYIIELKELKKIEKKFEPEANKEVLRFFKLFTKLPFFQEGVVKIFTLMHKNETDKLLNSKR